MTAKLLGVIMAGLLVLTACGDDDGPEAAATPAPTPAPTASPAASPTAPSGDLRRSAAATPRGPALRGQRHSRTPLLDVTGHSFAEADPTRSRRWAVHRGAARRGWLPGGR